MEVTKLRDREKKLLDEVQVLGDKETAIYLYLKEVGSTIGVNALVGGMDSVSISRQEIMNRFDCTLQELIEVIEKTRQGVLYLTIHGVEMIALRPAPPQRKKQQAPQKKSKAASVH